MDLYFTDSIHKYFDTSGTTYTSVSQLIAKFESAFDINFWGKAKGVERALREIKGDIFWDELMLKYKGLYKKKAWDMITSKFIKQNPKVALKYERIIRAEWKKENKDAIDYGNEEHIRYENMINASINFQVNKSEDTFKVFTIDDVINSDKKYPVDFSKYAYFEREYPQIYEAFVKYNQQGYDIFSELVTYIPKYKVCGTIDVPIINRAKGTFIIEDWKTNKDKLHFESGFYGKNPDGSKSSKWIKTKDKLKYPLNNLNDCKGSSYSLQQSLYAYLTEELTGFKCEGLYLNHMRRPLNEVQAKNKKLRYERVKLPYLKSEVKLMLKHHIKNK